MLLLVLPAAEEIEHGIFLGAGGFCTVTELMDVVLLSSSSPPENNQQTGDDDDGDAIPTAARSKEDPSSSPATMTTTTSKRRLSNATSTSNSTDGINPKNIKNNTTSNKRKEQEVENKNLAGHLVPADNSTSTISNTTSSTSTSSLPPNRPSFASQHSFIQDRSFIAQYHQRDGHARYAIKMLSKSTLAGRNSRKAPDHKKFIAGVVDLAMEVKYLSIIQHPHIIKMRGISKSHPCSESFFIILDRLYDTLSDRMKGWKKVQKRMSGLGSIRDLKGTKKEQAMGERLVVAYNICSALQFLHQNNIIYRDLKPDNIGFDVRDDVKIFDFGLAAEMHSSILVEGSNTYKLTAESGSPRYMAPEVALGQPYNHLADVYSFSLLLWEMCMVKTPFAGYDFETLNKTVFKGRNRPELNSKWNKPLRDVMEKCWSHRISDRLECDEIMTLLNEEIINAYGGDGSIVDSLNASSKTEASMIVKRAN